MVQMMSDAIADLRDPQVQHMEADLLDLVSGLWQPTASEVECLIDHLAGCPYCQILLATFVVQIAADTQDAASSEQLDHILSQLAATVHETLGKS
ncbi:MAG: hypothetical protein H0W02_05670 [Ktedonobacteraceae bacterium]|nr:hypothetical protein [Ktedonobacteraceae bacterium]